MDIICPKCKSNNYLIIVDESWKVLKMKPLLFTICLDCKYCKRTKQKGIRDFITTYTGHLNQIRKIINKAESPIQLIKLVKGIK